MMASHKMSKEIVTNALFSCFVSDLILFSLGRLSVECPAVFGISDVGQLLASVLGRFKASSTHKQGLLSKLLCFSCSKRTSFEQVEKLDNVECWEKPFLGPIGVNVKLLAFTLGRCQNFIRYKNIHLSLLIIDDPFEWTLCTSIQKVDRPRG